jgi:hypothetical protein
VIVQVSTAAVPSDMLPTVMVPAPCSFADVVAVVVVVVVVVVTQPPSGACHFVSLPLPVTRAVPLMYPSSSYPGRNVFCVELTTMFAVQPTPADCENALWLRYSSEIYLPKVKVPCTTGGVACVCVCV